MNLTTRHEEVNGHHINGSVSIDTDDGHFEASVLRIGGKVNSSFGPVRCGTRAEAEARMTAEFDDEVEWANAH